jgi:hypothetical protein
MNYIAIFSIKPGLFPCDAYGGLRLRIPKYPISVLGFSTSQNRIAPLKNSDRLFLANSNRIPKLF